MSALSWKTIPYERPLPRPITTAHGTYDRRAGFILKVTDSSGRYGLGDVAPLPGFSRESLNDAQTRFEELKDLIVRLPIPVNVGDLAIQTTNLQEKCAKVPSVLFGVETALADLICRRAGCTMAQWLSPQSARSVTVNALVSGDDDKPLRERARSRWSEGYTTFKVKVATNTVAQDVARVRELREELPEARIRIDANAGWDEVQFREAASAFTSLRLEFVEQPLPVGQIDTARSIACEFGLPLALDEEVQSIDDAVRIIQDRACDVLVIKPMMVGGLTGCHKLTELASRVGMGLVFTSSWESDVGLAATLHLAAAAGPVTRASGLATAGMIADGLVAPPLAIKAARLAIGKKPGLGLDLVSDSD